MWSDLGLRGYNDLVRWSGVWTERFSQWESLRNEGTSEEIGAHFSRARRITQIVICRREEEGDKGSSCGQVSEEWRSNVIVLVDERRDDEGTLCGSCMSIESVVLICDLTRTKKKHDGATLFEYCENGKTHAEMWSNCRTEEGWTGRRCAGFVSIGSVKHALLWSDSQTRETSLTDFVAIARRDESEIRKFRDKMSARSVLFTL